VQKENCFQFLPDLLDCSTDVLLWLVKVHRLKRFWLLYKMRVMLPTNLLTLDVKVANRKRSTQICHKFWI